MASGTDDTRWPCRVTQAWVPRLKDRIGRQCISIEVDQDAWVSRTTSSDIAGVWCWITVIETQASGWVPCEHLQRGSQRETPVRIDFIPSISKALPSTSLPNPGFPGPLQELKTILRTSTRTTNYPDLFFEVWTRMVDKDRGFIFFRKPPCRLLEDGMRENYAKVHVADSIFVSFPINRGPFLSINTIVHLAFELRTDGRPHDVSFSRLPLVGNFTDWRDLSKLAVRLEWQTPKGWYTFYLQHSESKEFEPEPAPGPYRDASALLALLNGQAYLKSAWRTQIPDVRIVDISFDHLSQKILVQECPERETHEPTKRAARGIISELVHKGFNVTCIAPTKIKDGEGRTMCDSCYVQKLRTNTEPGKPDGPRVECSFSSPNLTQCNRCVSHGRPCTFTPSEELMGSDKCREVGIFPLYEKVFPITAPQWHPAPPLPHFEGDEETEKN